MALQEIAPVEDAVAPSGDAFDAESGSGAVDRGYIFQCRSCRSVVGDSFAFASGDESAQVITLAAITTNVAVDSSNMQWSKEGFDVGSTFYNLVCTGCNEVIGKHHLTTRRSLDAIRDQYTFSTDKLQSYMFGDYANTDQEQALQSLRASGDFMSRCEHLTIAVCAFSERVKALEEALQTSKAPGDSRT